MRFVFWLLPSLLTAQSYDIVLQSGRVMDPESGLDAVRSVGITGNKIAAVSASPLRGKIEVDARNLVIAPGFLPLHTRTFTDRDDTLSLRLYDEEAARGLLGHPVGAADPAPAASPGRKIDGATGGPHRRTESGSPGIGSPRAASPERPKTDSAPAH